MAVVGTTTAECGMPLIHLCHRSNQCPYLENCVVISLILHNTVYEISNVEPRHKTTVENVILHLKPSSFIGAFITE